MKIIKPFLLLLLFASCRTARTTEAHPVVTTFEGDSLFFSVMENKETQIMGVSDLGEVNVSENLEIHKKFQKAITLPTRFSVNGSPSYIINPGDNVSLSLNEKGANVFKIIDNKQRNQELLFQHTLENLIASIEPRVPFRFEKYSIDTVLFLERQLKSEIPFFIDKSNIIFDSLSAAHKISDGFRMSAKLVLENREYYSLRSFYSLFKDIYIENGLYKQKQIELWSHYNNINQKEKMNLGAAESIINIGNQIMPKSIHALDNDKDVREDMRFVKKNLSALSRDCLLTYVLNKGIMRNIHISKKTMRFYHRCCHDKSYKVLIEKLLDERKGYAKTANEKTDDRLLSLSDKKIYTIDEVITRQKGKLVLIDLWASWCLPCLELRSSMESLQSKFTGDEVSFIYLSTDKVVSQWQRMNEQQGIDPKSSYMFENFDSKSSFCEKIKLTTIPRYILIDQNGEIISQNAPRPDDEALEKLIREHLGKNKPCKST